MFECRSQERAVDSLAIKIILLRQLLKLRFSIFERKILKSFFFLFFHKIPLTIHWSSCLLVWSQKKDFVEDLWRKIFNAVYACLSAVQSESVVTVIRSFTRPLIFYCLYSSSSYFRICSSFFANNKPFSFFKHFRPT